MPKYEELHIQLPDNSPDRVLIARVGQTSGPLLRLFEYSAIIQLDDGINGSYIRSHNWLTDVRDAGSLQFGRVESPEDSEPTFVPRMHISGGGNVGIGTVMPREKLEVQGNILATGDVMLSGADCAEEFDIVEDVDIEPGTLMVMNERGMLQPCDQAYDKRVVGVISGAGSFKPGLILDRQSSLARRVPIAILGKAFCKADAQYGGIEVGDLLTTAPTPGHAMRANDSVQAFGSVIGKALRSLHSGTGLVPLLVALK